MLDIFPQHYQQDHARRPRLDRSLSKAAGAAQIAGSEPANSRYDRVTIAFHWLTAALVLALFLIAQGWGFLDKPDRAPLKITHITLGVTLAGVIAARIVWRLFFADRVPAANVGLMNVATKLGHLTLYVLLALQLWLGFLIGWSGKKAAVPTFFGEIPSPLAAFTQEDHKFFENIHDWFGWAIIILATVHALVALFHHYVLRDNLLARMTPART
jgi:cytochrome b561